MILLPGDRRMARLEALTDLLIAVEERVSELIALPGMAKKRCLAGILRAENVRTSGLSQ